MPNGFTASIYEGKPTSLRDYLMGVARGMGYSIMQRDDAPGTPVREVEASDYYRQRGDELRSQLADLDCLTVAEAWARARREREHQVVWIATAPERGRREADA
jgi:hypothetical protein